jgi:choline-sulfatase
MRLTRKEFLHLAGVGPALPAAGLQDPQLQHRPNVLVIMTDQHRRNYLTAAGNNTVPTPNIDRIAARGVRFTNAICPYPVCAASRASLMTGLRPHTTGVINNNDILSWKTPTMAQHFASSGYHTALIGKMHFNDAHNHGFHYFLGFNDWLMYLGPKVHHYADEIANNQVGPQFFKTVNDDGSGFPELPGVWGGKLPWAGHVKTIGLPSELEPEDQFDAFVARESCRFLERYGQEPFLLVTSFLKPHDPFHPPRPWADRYPVESIDVPPIGDTTQYPKWIQRKIVRYQQLGPLPLRQHRAGYRGNLAYVDTCVGEVYRTLERLNLLHNTVVVYTADHGEMDGDHGIYDKFCLFEPSVGVPLIVSWPGVIPENKASNALTEYFGIFPTVAELAGLPAPRNVDAASFARVARDPSAVGPEAVFAEYNLRSSTDCYMVRTRKYKYIHNHGDIPELYDLESDPGEMVNRGADSGLARLRSELEERLRAWWNPERNSYRPAVKG